MFCDKCGKDNPAGSAFCEACGNPLNAAPAGNFNAPQGNPAPQGFGGQAPAPKKSNFDVKKILMIAIPAVLALILIIVFVSCLGSCGSDGALKAYFEGSWYGKNPKAFMEVMVDPVQMEYYFDEGEYDDKDDLLDYYKDRCDSTKDAYEDAKDEYGSVSAKYEIKKKYTYDKDEIEALGEYMEEEYEYGYDADDIEDVVTYKVKVTVRMDDDKNTDTDEYTFVKIKGKWCYKWFDREFIKDLD